MENSFCVLHLNEPYFLCVRENTPISIMLSFLRISGSNYAYDMLNINIRIKQQIFCLFFRE